MVNKNKLSFWTLLRTLLLLFVIFVTVYPFIYMVAVSFSKNIYVLRNEITFYPKGFNLDVYKKVFEDKRIFTAYKNTIIYVVLGTAIALFVTTTAAYALSKKNRCPFAKVINGMVIVIMFFNGGMIPTYLAINWLKIYNTIWAVVLPGALSAWNLIIMRSFFSTFPTEIEESGQIDGLNDLGILWFLVIPTSSAVIATIGLFYAVGLWNAFFGPFIYLRDHTKYPLQVILRQIVLKGEAIDAEMIVSGGKNIIAEDSIKYATIIVSILPIILVYPYLQKYFVKGVMIGSIKG
ncbi:MAG: carbohydrate ABC transporter permease [Firmicutes bacterium]|nr:carbohydrate ABC transporter permease [Bacillota bacterium]